MKLSLEEIDRILSALKRDHDPTDKSLINNLDLYRYRLTRL